MTQIQTNPNLQCIPQIVCIYDQYPLDEYIDAIRTVIDSTADEQYTKKNTKGAQLSGAVKKREFKESEILSRLQILNPKGVWEVTQNLVVKLRSIKFTETKSARKNVLKAAAQQRIILPGVDDEAIKSLTQWMYQGTLVYYDAENLYSILLLATKLGIDELTQTCLSKLATDAQDLIHQASSHGSNILILLGYGSSTKDQNLPPRNNIVEVIFKHVLKDSKPPKRLVEFVVEILARNMDVNLWTNLKDVIGHSLALQLVEAMVLLRQPDNLGLSLDLSKGTSMSASTKMETEHTDIEEEPVAMDTHLC